MFISVDIGENNAICQMDHAMILATGSQVFRNAGVVGGAVADRPLHGI
jgi:hypothetical protein